MLELVIGNYNYSSWSMRAWLHLRASGIPFTVTRIPLFSDEWSSNIDRYSPAGRVPVLLNGDVEIWDSMAILEYVIENYSQAIAWPDDRRARARARSICAEMHSGFIAIRNELPQNIRMRKPLNRGRVSVACQAQLRRIDAIWKECRSEFSGAAPWLFGRLSVADIVFIPMALRLVTYGITMSGKSEEFVSQVQKFAPVHEWIDAAAAEEESLVFIDDLRPVTETPLTPG